jgi:hypothetical protein
MDVTRGPERISPIFGKITFEENVNAYLRRALRMVQPNESITLDIPVVPSGRPGEAAFDIVTPLARGDGVVTRWPISGAGEYSLAVQYSMPRLPVEGRVQCAGNSPVVTVRVTVR